jgi:hypothetical protein
MEKGFYGSANQNPIERLYTGSCPVINTLRRRFRRDITKNAHVPVTTPLLLSLSRCFKSRSASHRILSSVWSNTLSCHSKLITATLSLCRRPRITNWVHPRVRKTSNQRCQGKPPRCDDCVKISYRTPMKSCELGFTFPLSRVLSAFEFNTNLADQICGDETAYRTSLASSRSLLRNPD